MSRSSIQGLQTQFCITLSLSLSQLKIGMKVLLVGKVHARFALFIRLRMKKLNFLVLLTVRSDWTCKEGDKHWRLGDHHCGFLPTPLMSNYTDIPLQSSGLNPPKMHSSD